MGLPDEKFYVHQNVLAQSPVFASMCKHPGFEEGRTRHIHLPDDDAETFGLLLDYLFSRNWEPPRASFESQMESHVDLYIIADKYDVGRLKIRIQGKVEVMVQHLCAPRGLRRLTANGGLPEDTTVCDFFKAMKRLYENLPESDNTFRAFFVRQSEWVLGIALPKDYKVLDDLIADGGPFAVDMFKAQRRARRPVARANTGAYENRWYEYGP